MGVGHRGCRHAALVGRVRVVERRHGARRGASGPRALPGCPPSIRRRARTAFRRRPRERTAEQHAEEALLDRAPETPSPHDPHADESPPSSAFDLAEAPGGPSAPARKESRRAGSWHHVIRARSRVGRRACRPVRCRYGAGLVSQGERVSPRRRSRRGPPALYTKLQTKFPGSDEARLSHVSLGKLLLSSGKAADAERQFALYVAAGSRELVEEALVGRAESLQRLGRRRRRAADLANPLERLARGHLRCACEAAARQPRLGCPAFALTLASMRVRSLAQRFSLGIALALASSRASANPPPAGAGADTPEPADAAVVVLIGDVGESKALTALLVELLGRQGVPVRFLGSELRVFEPSHLLAGGEGGRSHRVGLRRAREPACRRGLFFRGPRAQRFLLRELARCATAWTTSGSSSSARSSNLRSRRCCIRPRVWSRGARLGRPSMKGARPPRPQGPPHDARWAGLLAWRYAAEESGVGPRGGARVRESRLASNGAGAAIIAGRSFGGGDGSRSRCHLRRG